ncbi:MAG: exo-alpha-sialidase, partial [Chloroflexi bacterium]|nr:exo-alpha-sialidase [Chloroflexota bacterium]
MIEASRNRKLQKWATPLIGLILVTIMLLANFSVGYSQSPTPEATIAPSSTNWSAPVNISQTGGASEPTVIMDSTGRFHIVWWDEFSGFMYAGGDGKEWSEAKAVRFPFSPSTTTSTDATEPQHPKPIFIADLNGRIHAFWLDGQTLYYSNVYGTAFGARAAWYAGKILAESVLAADVAMDSAGNLHLAFVRTSGSFLFSPGIYYLRLPNGTFAWENTTLIDESPYLRIVAAEDANIHISVGKVDNHDRVYLVWDVLPRGRVFAAQLDTTTGKWSEPAEVDGPSTTSGPTSARNIRVNALDANVVRTWQIGEQGAGCAQYYQQSSDGGDTWTQRRRFLANLQGCPDDAQFMVTKDGSLLTLVTINDRIYLMAWDGSQWSSPQLQNSLSSFVDPDTLNMLDFRYGRAALGPDNQIYIVGYDQTGSGDIWLSSRALGSIAGWFPDQASWGSPSPLAKSQAFFASTTLIADSEGQFHALWSDNESTDAVGNQAIYYSRWNGKNWSPAVAVISFPLGSAKKVSAAMDQDGKILLVWGDSSSGKILFSSADANQAANPEQWGEPMVLPSPENLAQSPNILVNSDGKVLVIYALPVNEGRGLYLIESSDNGETWSDPKLIFDAAAAGWSMVDQPSVALGEANEIFLMFTQYTIAGETVPVGITYMSSLDDGVSWSEPVEVVEGNVSLGQLIAENETTIHRIWQGSDDSGYTLWHEVSYDDGQSWGERKPFESLSGKYEPAYLTKDVAGRVHLFELRQETSGGVLFDQWLWSNQVWARIDQFELGNQVGTVDLKAVSGVTGEVGVLYGVTTTDADTQKLQENLYVTERKLDLPVEAQPTAAVMATPEASPQVAATETQVVPTATQPFSKDAPLGGEAAGGWSGLLVGIVVA